MSWAIPESVPYQLPPPNTLMTTEDEMILQARVAQSEDGALDQFRDDLGLPGAAFLALRYSRTRPVDFFEALSYAYEGLEKSMAVFDWTRGVRFWTYAAFRVWGEMLDGYRREDWVPRLVRSRSSQVAAYLEARGLDSVAESDLLDLAEWLGTSTEKAREVLEDSHVVKVYCVDDRNENWVSFLEESAADLDLSGGQRAVDLKDGFRFFLRHLKETREAVILHLRYWQGLTLQEIADRMGLSESRVCQLHTRVLNRLGGEAILRRLWTSDFA